MGLEGLKRKGSVLKTGDRDCEHLTESFAYNISRQQRMM